MNRIIVPSKIEWLNLDGRRGYAINSYTGCAWGCLYCWSRELQRISYKDWCQPKLRPAFADYAPWQVLRAIPENANILLSASCDPFQVGLPREPLWEFYTQLWDGAKIKEATLYVLTKAGEELSAFLRRIHTLPAFFHRWDQQHIGVTITSLEQNPWEPQASTPVERLKALRFAKALGLRTYISIEPWLQDITDPIAIIEHTRAFCDWWVVGSHNKRMRAINPDFYRREMPQLLTFLDKEGLREKVFIKRELRRLV